MDFKDYYKILEINQIATQKEVKAAFKNQAVKWHPDKNLEIDTTQKMQEITEAYLILKDKEARGHYDREYLKYAEFIKKSNPLYKEHTSKGYKHSRSTNNTKEANYEFDDKTLKKWIKNARVQAVDLAKQTIHEIGELSATAAKSAGLKMLQLFISYAIIGIISLLILKTCAN